MTRKERFERLLQLLRSDDERVSMEAAKHMDAYDYGKPAQSLEVSGAEGEPLQIVINKITGGEHAK